MSHVRLAVVAVLLLCDRVLTRHPTVVLFLTLWSSIAATWVGTGARLW